MLGTLSVVIVQSPTQLIIAGGNYVQRSTRSNMLSGLAPMSKNNASANVAFSAQKYNKLADFSNNENAPFELCQNDRNDADVFL